VISAHAYGTSTQTTECALQDDDSDPGLAAFKNALGECIEDFLVGPAVEDSGASASGVNLGVLSGYLKRGTP